MTWLGKDLIVDSLTELASEVLQRTRWMSDGSSDISSFVEVVEQLFTDSGLEDALEKGNSGYSNEVEHLFKQLDALVSKVDGYKNPCDIMSDPKMILIREKAAQILQIIEN